MYNRPAAASLDEAIAHKKAGKLTGETAKGVGPGGTNPRPKQPDLWAHRNRNHPTVRPHNSTRPDQTRPRRWTLSFTAWSITEPRSGFLFSDILVKGTKANSRWLPQNWRQSTGQS